MDEIADKKYFSKLWLGEFVTNVQNENVSKKAVLEWALGYFDSQKLLQDIVLNIYTVPVPFPSGFIC